MRLLIDNALSPRLAEGLREVGYDAVHVRDLGMQSAEDAELFDLAADEDRVLISEDTDFGTLLSLRGAAKPSVVLLRHMPDRSAAALLVVLLANFAAVEADLELGAVVVLEPGRIRVRRLPITSRI